MRQLISFIYTPAEQSEAGSKGGQRKLVFTFVMCSLFFCWLLFNHASPWTRKIVSDLTGLTGAVLASVWALQGRLKQKKRVWGADLLTGYLVLYTIGMAFWTYLELFKREEAPFPSIADAFYIPSQLCLMAGIVLLPLRRAPAALRGRVFLDGLMVMAALVAFSWYFVLGPNMIAMAATVFAKVVGIFYPLSDLSMLVCLLVLTARVPSSALRTAYNVLTVGVLGIVVIDSLYGYMALQGTYASGSLLDVGWPLSQLLISLSVTALRKAPKEAHDSGTESSDTETLAEQNPVLWRSILPYALVPPLSLLIVFVERTHQNATLELGVYASAATLVGLILLRQVFALLENNRLYGFLKQAYRELEISRQEMEVKNVLMEQVNANLAEANARLEELATTDGMTGLLNHRAFQEKLREQWTLMRTTESSLSLLLLDVDKFKTYNDTFGHPAGDEALRIVAQQLKANIHSTHFAARYGGEEFAILLPLASSEQVWQLAEKIRSAIEAYPFPHRAVTISIGIAEATSQCSSPERLIVNADSALYLAKSEGRNCIRQAKDEEDILQKAA